MKSQAFKEIGRISEGWKTVKLWQLGEIVTGTTPSTKVKEYWGDGIPFITPTDFSGTKYVEKTERTVTRSGAERGRIIPKNSIMVVCIASVGEVSMNLTECITNQQINTIIPNQKTIPSYLYYVMISSKERLRRMSGITTSPIIKKSSFAEFKLPLPSLPEQEKIADILSAVDEGIEKTGQAIAKTERLKMGLMQTLLTKGIGHKKFKDTKIGKIPEEWETKKLNEIAPLKDGDWILNKDYSSSGIRLLQVGDIGIGKFMNKSSRYISTQRAKELNCTLLEFGDILISRMPDPIGRACMLPRLPCSCITAVDVTIWRPNENKANRSFLMQYLNSTNWLNHVSKLASGATRIRVSRINLENISIPIPPLPEQKRIAEILSTIDRRLELLRQRKARQERVKQGLMNDLLTGRKRVIHH